MLNKCIIVLMVRGCSMLFAETALIAYATDRLLGEFHFIRHPVILMGDYIQWFEKHFYKDSIFRGALLSLSLITVTLFIIYIITYMIHSLLPSDSYLLPILYGIIASTTIASKMLYDSVKDILIHPHHIKYLVSRDTESLSQSEVNKAAVETYAENLSDGVIAPLFWLLLLGLPGAFVYKAVNTLDSMIGYRTPHYEKFGKVSARLDDWLNYIPARITALLILLLSPKCYRSPTCYPPLSTLLYQASRHDSPNAGYPITAMAWVLDIRLGGPTRYFGKVKEKAYFGVGREMITTDDIRRALAFRNRVDGLVLGGLAVLSFIS